MATARLYYQNLLLPSTVAGFSVAGAAVAMAAVALPRIYPYRAGSVLGSVRFNASTGYTAPLDKDFVIEIQSSTDGTFPNTRWRWNNNGGTTTWNASNLTPVSGTWVALSDGVEWQFLVSGLTPEFVTADRAFFRVIHTYGIAAVLDGSRNSEYRSGNLPAGSTLRIGFDLGSSQQPGFLGIADHNLRFFDGVTLFGHATTLFTETGGGSQVVTVRAVHLAELVTMGPYRYWWLRIVVGVGGLSYLRISELALAIGQTLAFGPAIGRREDPEYLSAPDVAVLVNGPIAQIGTAEHLTLTWLQRQRDLTGDGTKLDAAFAYATQQSSLQQKPFWYVANDADLSTARLKQWVSLQREHHESVEAWTYTTTWVEVLRRVTS